MIGIRFGKVSLIWAVLVLFFGCGVFSERVWGQFSWGESSAGVYNFSDDANWVGGVAPAASETEHVTIGAGVGTTTINFTADQEFLGGFRYDRRRSGDGVVTNLGTAVDPITLTVVGTFQIIPTFAAPQLTFEHGTVRLGTGAGSATEADFHIATSGSVESLTVFSAGSTLDFQNVSDFLLGSVTGNARPFATLDLSEAQVRSGSDLNHIVVKDAVVMGTYNGQTGNRGGVGHLFLPSTWVSADWGALTMAQNLRTAGTTDERSYAEATLDLGGGTAVQEWLVRDRFVVGRGDEVEGVILNPSTNLHLQVGVDATERASELWFGYKDRTQGVVAQGADSSAVGLFTASGGSFTAYVEELRVGENTQPSVEGSALGVLDLSAATLGVLDISGDARIGIGVNAEGDLRLSGGEAASLNLLVGSSEGTSSGRLDLGDTLWSVAETLVVGETGTVNLYVEGTPSGLDLLSSNAADFVIEDGGMIEAVFHVLTEVWAVRMPGDHVALFEQYVTEGKLVASGDYAGFSAVEFDGDHTTFGLIPEPHLVALLVVLGLLPIVMYRRRAS